MLTWTTITRQSAQSHLRAHSPAFIHWPFNETFCINSREWFKSAFLLKRVLHTSVSFPEWSTSGAAQSPHKSTLHAQLVQGDSRQPIETLPHWSTLQPITRHSRGCQPQSVLAYSGCNIGLWVHHYNSEMKCPESNPWHSGCPMVTNNETNLSVSIKQRHAWHHQTLKTNIHRSILIAKGWFKYRLFFLVMWDSANKVLERKKAEI